MGNQQIDIYERKILFICPLVKFSYDVPSNCLYPLASQHTQCPSCQDTALSCPAPSIVAPAAAPGASHQYTTSTET